MNETPRPFVVSASTTVGCPGRPSRTAARRPVGDRPQVVAVEADDPPAEGRPDRGERVGRPRGAARPIGRIDPAELLQTVDVDDRDELVELGPGRERRRLPDLALLALPVAEQHEHAHVATLALGPEGHARPRPRCRGRASRSTCRGRAGGSCRDGPADGSRGNRRYQAPRRRSNRPGPGRRTTRSMRGPSTARTGRGRASPARPGGRGGCRRTARSARRPRTAVHPGDRLWPDPPPTRCDAGPRKRGP